VQASMTDNATITDRRTIMTGYTSPAVAARGAAPRMCRLFPTDFKAAAVPFKVQSAEWCFVNSQSNRDRQSSVADY